MIELVYLENGFYIKKLLEEAYDAHLKEIEEWVSTFSFKEFVERVFTDIINWYTYDMQEDDNRLALLNFDTEKAEDLLDSISSLSISKLEEWDVKFSVEYLVNRSSIIVRSAKTMDTLILPDPSIYKQNYDKLHKTQLTKIGRILNELRISKAGKLGKL